MNGPTLPPPPPPPPPGAPPSTPDPLGPDLDGDRSLLGLLVGLVVTALIGGGLVALWPEDAPAPTRTATAAEVFAEFSTTVPGALGEPSALDPGPLGRPELPQIPEGPTVLLFERGAPDAVQQVLAAAGGPTQVLRIVVYDTYLVAAYRDPAAPANIDRRLWRSGVVDEPSPNPIDDRVDADTEPALFDPASVDLAVLPRLVADAASRYDVPVEVTHIIIDRFLPFDERVLFRVYTTPTDGRSGGGYVSYDLAGSLVKVCC